MSSTQYGIWDCGLVIAMGGRHHQKYQDVKQISKNKAGLRISCRTAQLTKEWHGQIVDSLVFLHETEPPKYEQFSQMINGLVAHVELEIEIVKWTSSIANNLALSGGHHQKYQDVKQISKNKAGLRISCKTAQLIKEWHGQIIDSLLFLHETEHPKHEQFSQMINSLVAHVELEIEIVKWTSSIANNLAPQVEILLRSY